MCDENKREFVILNQKTNNINKLRSTKAHGSLVPGILARWRYLPPHIQQTTRPHGYR